MLVLDPKPNVELLTRVLAHIETEPDSWKQESFRYHDELSACATAFCFAGHAAVMTGAQVPAYRWTDWSLAEDGTVDEDSDVHVADWARVKLGLTEPEAAALFAWHNNLATLRKHVVRYIARAEAIEAYEAFQAEQVLTAAAEVMADIAFLDAEASQEVAA